MTSEWERALSFVVTTKEGLDFLDLLSLKRGMGELFLLFTNISKKTQLQLAFYLKIST